jgi:hypothetical protein
VWIATGHTDMRRGMNWLALLVQEASRETRTAATTNVADPFIKRRLLELAKKYDRFAPMRPTSLPAIELKGRPQLKLRVPGVG